MPKRRVNGEIPLPAGWDMAQDYDGKIYFIDHASKQTTWVDPRDRLTKPATFADCVGNELPVGWEEAYDPLIGVYYIDHINQRTQLEDPHLSWRAYQEAMLRDYLATASEELQAKRETLDVKTRRLGIAEDEYQHLNAALSGMQPTLSTSSLTSVGSGRYDPELLKQDVQMAKLRVLSLRQELMQIRKEVSIKQQGLNTLAQVEQKMSTGSCYTMGEAQAIMNELRSIQRSLISGEKERMELMQCLARHKEDLTRLQSMTKFPDMSSFGNSTEKLSTASQTDLPGDLVPLGARLAEMAKLRLEYDARRKDVQHIQRRLSELEESIEPGEVESDKDRLLLFQEKEQLLRELRSICPKNRPLHEIAGIHQEIQRLENDLSKAAEMAKKNITDRLRLHEEKQTLLQNLRDALNNMASLESRLKSLSASTLSISSSSSLASLSSSQASSKGSLSSLSFTDIYGAPSTHTEGINMLELQKRVEQLLQSETSPVASLVQNRSQLQTVTSQQSFPSLSPRSSLSSVSPPVSPYDLGPPPSYEQSFLDKQRRLAAADKLSLEDSLGDLSITEENTESEKSGSYFVLPPLSPISEYVASEEGNVCQSSQPTAHCQTQNSSGTSTRSVSAAVSDESVAGDSGVFEASNNHRCESQEVSEINAEAAQVQVKLRYSVSDCILHVGIERARNLNVLFVPVNHKLVIKAALLPCNPGLPSQYCTKPVDFCDKLTIGEDFSIGVQLARLYGKTLQVNLFAISPSGQEQCAGCSQVSLAEFNAESSSSKWYNILSFHFLQLNPKVEAEDGNLESTEVAESSISINHTPQDSESSSSLLAGSSGRHNIGVKEESSDESTIISSQTSTLTRHHDVEVFQSDLEKWNEGAVEWRCDNWNDEEEENEIVEEDNDEISQRIVLTSGEMTELTEEVVNGMEAEEIEIMQTRDQSTNTECVFVKTKPTKEPEPTMSKGIVIKRSQTFSPSAVANKQEYICRLNRSDSDSSMPLYRKPPYSSISHRSLGESVSAAGSTAFQRGSMERKSLRLKKISPPVGSSLAPIRAKSKPAVVPVRTSIDLELDRQVLIGSQRLPQFPFLFKRVTRSPPSHSTCHFILT
ncbi:Protein kibra [Orchesella cincta]|uniref:Protein kibra n=1 Tax=Orchesella cincta TaxID=48709 RepID=A0A1D2NDD2_ORCCI|nr:Protein kibra [Orchesella cincta]